MSKMYVYLAIIISAVITYLIRVIPLLLFRKEIKSVFFKSFLTYAPYVTLSALTFPSVFYCTGNTVTAAVGTIVAFACNFFSKSMLLSVVISCASVYLLQLIL